MPLTDQQRSIPAWAGETPGWQGLSSSPPVYPRVGGGNLNVNTEPHGILGLSPRGRGKPHNCRGHQDPPRSIPAWAGETGSPWPCRPQWTVYPRVGGGNSPGRTDTTISGGLSPRGRGKRCADCPCPWCKRSIPAWAGETVEVDAETPYAAVYPRVGGGNQSSAQHDKVAAGLSPRGRGKPVPRRLTYCRLRSIPAWAGETRYRQRPGQRPEVYPRVGGGNAYPPGRRGPF